MYQLFQKNKKKSVNVLYGDCFHLWQWAYFGALNQGIYYLETSGAFEDVFCHEPSRINTPPYGVTTPRQKNVTSQVMNNI